MLCYTRKRNSFTLLEVLIALVLASFLLWVLFNTFVQIHSFYFKIDRAKKKIFCRQILQERLVRVFAQISYPEEVASTSLEKEKAFFYVERNPANGSFILFFSYDNELDPDPNFCSKLKGMLYLNEKKELCLLSKT